MAASGPAAIGTPGRSIVIVNRFEVRRPRLLIAVAASCASALVLSGVLSVFSPPRAPPVIAKLAQQPKLAAALH